MARGQIKEKNYTGKALKIYERVQKLEAELKTAKEELAVAYKEQLKEEKEAAKKESKAVQAKLLKAIKDSGKSPEEIIEMLSSNTNDLDG